MPVLVQPQGQPMPHNCERSRALLETDADLLAGWLTWEHPKHRGAPVFVEEESEKLYLPRPELTLIITDADRLRAAALADIVKQGGWDVRCESPWDYTGSGAPED